MKRYMALLLIIATSMALASCKKPGNDSTTESSAGTSQSVTQTQPTSGGTSTTTAAPITGGLLASQQHDLDGDGEAELIKILRNKHMTGGVTGYTSYLIIGTKDDTDKISKVFSETDNEMSGKFSELEFADFDGDGRDDVFITLQEAASPFTQSNYYIYSYSEDREHTFLADMQFHVFCESFEFKYLGDGILKISHPEHAFIASIPIKGGTIISDAMGKKYEQSWVEPVPVDLEGDFGTTVATVDGTARIKIVLPIFGLATSDFIGTIEVFYEIDEDFEQNMTDFAIYGIINQKLEQVAAVKIR